MIDYLKKYNLTDEDISYLHQYLKETSLTNFEVMRLNVEEVLTYLKDIGVINLFGIIKERPDICFRETTDLKIEIEKLDKNLIVFIMNNTLDDLVNFNI